MADQVYEKILFERVEIELRFINVNEFKMHLQDLLIASIPNNLNKKELPAENFSKFEMLIKMAQ